MTALFDEFTLSRFGGTRKVHTSDFLKLQISTISAARPHIAAERGLTSASGPHQQPSSISETLTKTSSSEEHLASIPTFNQESPVRCL